MNGIFSALLGVFNADGDINEDGSVDLKDVVLIRRHIVGGWDV